MRHVALSTGIALALLACSTSQNDEEAVGEFRAAFALLDHAKYVATYEADFDGNAFDLTVVKDQKCELWRLENGSEVLLLGQVGDEPILCMLTEEEFRTACVEQDYSRVLPFTTLPLPGTFKTIVDRDNLKSLSIRSFSEDIAGFRADCFEATTRDYGLKICFGPDGEFLSGRTASAEYSASIEAIRVTGDLPSTGVDLPYPLVRQ